MKFRILTLVGLIVVVPVSVRGQQSTQTMDDEHDPAHSHPTPPPTEEHQDPAPTPPPTATPAATTDPLVITTTSGLVQSTMDIRSCQPHDSAPPMVFRLAGADHPNCSFCRWDLRCSVDETVRGSSTPTTRHNVPFEPSCGPPTAPSGSVTQFTCPAPTDCYLSSHGTDAHPFVTALNRDGQFDRVSFRSPLGLNITATQYRDSPRTRSDLEARQPYDVPNPAGGTRTIQIRAFYREMPERFTFTGDTCGDVREVCSAPVDMQTFDTPTSPPVEAVTQVICPAPDDHTCPSATDCLKNPQFQEPLVARAAPEVSHATSPTAPATVVPAQ